MVLNINGGKHPIPISTPLAMSPQTFLAWAGFTDEGTPAITDSTGIVRIINAKYGYSWSSILNTKSHVSI